MNMLKRGLLALTILYATWMGMMAVHEVGHVA